MITMENKQRVKTIAVIFIIAIVLISLITEFYIFSITNIHTASSSPKKAY
jgi:heme/copper-type cytochrome/quinol oxidase subunit 4